MTWLEDFPDQPFSLIEFDEENDTLRVNEKAVELIKQIQGKVAVIAMAGLYRTGKSSMLNWIMGKQKGFRVGPTVERCTRGIWVWGKPQEVTFKDGEPGWLLVLDTEGLGGLEASQQYDVRIFSLATLLCSKLIYNSQGSVDEKAINGLSFIANMTKHIRIRAEPSESDLSEDETQEFHNFFPSFLWLVRDFTLELVDEDGDPITSNEYLEKSLAPQQGYNQATMERNRVRQMMTSFFQSRDCFTIVRPVHNEEQLQQVDNLAISDLRPEFQQELKELKDLVFHSLTAKSMNGRELNGTMFAGLLESYIGAINSGGVPTISSAWDGVTASECRNAMNKAMEVFKREMDEKTSKKVLPLDERDLDVLVSEMKSEALKQYETNAIGDAAKKYREDLTSKMAEEISQLSQRNAQLAKENCHRLLQAAFTTHIQSKLNSEECYDDIQDFAQDWENFRKQYENEARGPEKTSILYQFTESKMTEVMRILLARRNDKFDARLRAMEEEITQTKEELSLIEGKEEVYTQQIEAMQNENASILHERARLEADAAAKESMIATLDKKLREGEVERETFKKEKLTVVDELKEERDQNSELRSEYEKLRDAAQKWKEEKEKHEMEISMLSDENQTLRKSSTCGSCVIC